MKPFKIIAIGVVCSVAVVIGVLVIFNTLDKLIDDQQERNYNRFVQNVDGLTNTFRQPVVDCAQKAVELEDYDCIVAVDEEYRIHFGSLIKLFGYEPYIQELYQYWQADLQYWYESKKIQLEYSQTPDFMTSEIKRISDIREKAVQARLQPGIASKVESRVTSVNP